MQEKQSEQKNIIQEEANKQLEASLMAFDPPKNVANKDADYSTNQDIRKSDEKEGNLQGEGNHGEGNKVHIIRNDQDDSDWSKQDDSYD